MFRFNKTTKCFQSTVSKTLRVPKTFFVRWFSYNNTLLEIREFRKSESVKSRKEKLECLMNVLFKDIVSRPLDQPIFIQAVNEVMTSLKPFLLKNPKYSEVLPLLIVPEQVHMFCVPWVDDQGLQRVNNGYRVQFNQSLGPYKGGLRFHPSVDLSIIKFLGFEQTFKNALTGLPIGGGKGGSDFNPKGKSDREIYKFCRSFMTNLSRVIGPDKDVPAGDIGVGQKEIGYMFGQYKRITNLFHGALTGKAFGWGGSHLRPEATGYGLIYISQCHLNTKSENFQNKRCLVSGSGNVAQFACEKLIQLGAKVITLSDSNGTIINENGFTKDQLSMLTKLKDSRKRCSEITNHFNNITYVKNQSPWDLSIEADYAFPCATQNEINHKHAENFTSRKIKGVFEGANMPLTNKAIDVIFMNSIDYIPGKAANAGGVAVSCLEMAQNSARLVWKREKVDQMLKEIMQNIYKSSIDAAKEVGNEGNIQVGANTVAFKRVADAMFQQGLVYQSE